MLYYAAEMIKLLVKPVEGATQRKWE